jgi:hypothetical protein
MLGLLSPRQMKSCGRDQEFQQYVPEIHKKFANQDARMMRKTIVQEYGIKVSE